MKRIGLFLAVMSSTGLVVFLAAAPPRLQVVRQGTNVVVSWPAADAPNYFLQQSTTPLFPGGWSLPAPTPTLNGGIYSFQLPATNRGDFFRLKLEATGLLDEPDDAFADTNGDGIDGDVTKAIFVATAGDDLFAGTRAQPVRTLAEGVRRAALAGKQVYVAAGVYTSDTLVVSNGVSVYGGYNAADWSRSDANSVLLTVANATAVHASNIVTGTTLDHLTLQGADAVIPGMSAYGVVAIDSAGLIIRRCSIRAGHGGSGVSGVAGVVGADGGAGGQGRPGCEDSSGFGCSNCSRPSGGIGGASPCGNPGGVGGLPGNGTNAGQAGGMGGGGTAGGSGANCGGSPGCVGIVGTAGVPGVPGADGTAGLPGNFALTGYQPVHGTEGAAGASGNGGGGGGGGGGGDDSCDSYGSSGGGGGSGACGGAPATGGLSGGGSLAIYLWNSSARIEFCTLQTGHGGNGGTGGTGGGGGMGGASGPGGPYGGSSEQDDGGFGAAGGKGGDGGRGGHGGGGAGGSVIGIVRAGGSTPVLASLSYVLGLGGAGGNSPGNAGPTGTVANLLP